MPWWHPSQQWWSWVLSGLGIIGTEMAGRRMASGWLVRLGAIGLWIVFGVLAGQWGFVFLPLVQAGAYARNWVRWRRDAAAGLEVPDGA